MWILGLLVFLPLLTAGLLFFIQGDKLRDAVVKVSAAAIAMLSLFVAFTYFGNKVVFRLGDSFLAQGAILVDGGRERHQDDDRGRRQLLAQGTAGDFPSAGPAGTTGQRRRGG